MRNLLLAVATAFSLLPAAYAQEGNAVTQTPQAAPVKITADFAVPVDNPLVKTKFGVYNSGVVPLSHYERDIPLFDEVHPDSLRVDLAWGTRWAGWKTPPVSGTAEQPVYDFGEMDRIATLLNEKNVTPFWSYCYVPLPVQNQSDGYRSVPTEMGVWGKILGDYAHHAKQGGPLTSVGHHEIYNEPDNGDFFRGKESDYLAMYDSGANALRAADPDGKIGGPALAFSDAWVAPFLDHVVEKRLPLDFFSFHFYPGVPYHAHDIRGVVEMVRGQLAARPSLATTEAALDEYNAYPIDYPEGGRQDHFVLASALLHNYQFFLTQPWLTAVHWAQFMDTGGGNWSGMISLDGHRKAVFNAYLIYSRMPVDRRQVSLAGPEGLEGMASADAHRAGLVFWNRTGQEQTAQISLAHLPVTHGHLRVFRIDASHASWGDDPANERLLPIETRPLDHSRTQDWTGAIPDGGVVYLEADDDTGHSDLAPNQVAKVIRTLHYYPDRAKTAYADFDDKTWIARLGMGLETSAEATVGATAEGLPPILSVSAQSDGRLVKQDPDSLLAVRLDYQVGAVYTKSVLFHGKLHGSDLYDPHRRAPMPWGTQRQPNLAVRVRDFSQFQIAPHTYAPPGWIGRVQITFIMQNTGPGTRAKITLSRP
jgi:xylan 1,4-beta-xylosidase